MDVCREGEQLGAELESGSFRELEIEVEAHLAALDEDMMPSREKSSESPMVRTGMPRTVTAIAAICMVLAPETYSRWQVRSGPSI